MGSVRSLGLVLDLRCSLESDDGRVTQMARSDEFEVDEGTSEMTRACRTDGGRYLV